MDILVTTGFYRQLQRNASRIIPKTESHRSNFWIALKSCPYTMSPELQKEMVYHVKDRTSPATTEIRYEIQTIRWGNIMVQVMKTKAMKIASIIPVYCAITFNQCF